MLKESILNIEVSCFQNYWEEKNPRNVNLLTWLTSTKYREKVEAIRAIEDKNKRAEIKPTLPAITPSGIFKTRETKIPLEEKLIKHTGLIQIDIDLTEKNKLITNWEDLKAELIKLPNIAYLGKSVSGRGYWGLIPIPPEPEDHKKYFEALNKIFWNKWGIELDDKPKNVASLRGYSYDPEGYFNHQAVPFYLKLERQITVPKVTQKTSNPSPGLGVWIISKMEKLLPGERHGKRFDLARLAGGFVANGYLDDEIEERLIQSYLSQYESEDSPQDQVKEIKAIRDGFETGKKDPIAPKTNCLFVPIRKFEDYSEKSFKIWQGIKTYFIPKSQVYEIIDTGFYISESFLRSDPKSPKWQDHQAKELKFDAVCQHHVTTSTPLSETPKEEEPEAYISQLYIENGMILNGMGYPADWDLIGSYTDKPTKDFIRMAVKNPVLLELRRKFDLS